MDTQAQAKGATEIPFLNTQNEAKSVAISRNVTDNGKIICGPAETDVSLVATGLLPVNVQGQARGADKFRPGSGKMLITQGQAGGAAKIPFLKTQNEAKSIATTGNTTGNGKIIGGPARKDVSLAVTEYLPVNVQG